MTKRSAFPILLALAAVLGVTSVTLAAPPSTGRAAGAVPQGVLAPEWGWVVDRLPTAGNLIPSAKDQGNSSGAVNTIDKIDVGWYRVTFTGIGSPNGNVLVSALGTNPKICLADSWIEVGSAPTDEQVDVRCFDKTGAPNNTGFVVNYLSASGTGAGAGRLAYANDYSPTSNCGTPGAQYDSKGGTVSSCPLQDEHTVVRFPGLGSGGGTVQVSAIAHRPVDSSDVVSVGFCDLLSFGSGIVPEAVTEQHPTGVFPNPYEFVTSHCYSDAAATSDYYREYNVWFMQGLGMKGTDRTNVAYVLAGHPTRASYTPNPDHTYSSSGGSIRVTRQGTGHYTVQLNGMPKGGSAQVTAFGPDKRRCTISTISYTLPQKVGVRCFNAVGDPRDAKFNLAYAR